MALRRVGGKKARAGRGQNARFFPDESELRMTAGRLIMRDLGAIIWLAYL